MKLLRYGGNPILSPNPANEWENLVVCNPGVILDDGVFYMLYRAAGDDEKHVIRFGLATSTDGFHFQRVSDRPVFGPSADGPDSGCVEDARIVKFGDTFYVTYAYRPMAPGRIIFEAEGVSLEIAKEAMRLGANKLPVATKFIVRRDYVE